jgi:hypothetical protein
MRLVGANFPGTLPRRRRSTAAKAINVGTRDEESVADADPVQTARANPVANGLAGCVQGFGGLRDSQKLARVGHGHPGICKICTTNQQLCSYRGGITQCRGAGYAWRMRSDRAPSGFKLIEMTEPAVLASLERIDSLSDQELRELAREEPQIIVDAAEGIIADRHIRRPGVSQGH